MTRQAIIAFCISLLVPISAHSAPIIITQPADQLLVAGGTATFQVNATGTSPISYQWQISTDNGADWSNLSDAGSYVGTTTSALTLNAVPLNLQGTSYRVSVTDPTGTITSSTGTLEVDVSELWGVGATEYGQLGTGVLGYHPSPVQVNTTMQQVVAFGSSSFFLKTDGTLWAAGSNAQGTLFDGTTLNRSIPVQIASDVTKVSSWGGFALFIKSDHTLWGVGANSVGQLGTGDQTNRVSPVQIATGVVDCSAGVDYSLFVRSDQSLWGMGDNVGDQLGLATLSTFPTPQQISSGVMAVWAGYQSSAYLKSDGTLWAMGADYYGQLGDGTGRQPWMSIQVDTNVETVAMGRYHTLWVKSDGTLWATGKNSNGQLGDGTTISRLSPVQVDSNVSAVGAGFSQSFYVKTDHSLWATGANTFGQLGVGSTTEVHSPVQVAQNVASVSGGISHVLFIKTDGTTWAAGNNDYGQFGDGTNGYVNQPHLIDTNVVNYAAGPDDTLYVKSDGTAWGLGHNNVGQLGDGTTQDRASPVQITQNVLTVAAGYQHSLLLKSDQTLWGMGSNSFGQLGLGATTSSSIPAKIDTDVSAIQTAAAANHTLYLKTDHTLWGNGLNTSGQLGDNTTTNHTLPFAIIGGVQAAATTGSSSLILKNDGSLWATGSNAQGSFGNGTTASSLVPVAVQTGNELAKIAAGEYHGLFLRGDQTLWAAGANFYGQLGTGTASSFEATPVEIGQGVIMASAGIYDSVFVKSDGSLWATGLDSYGYFGLPITSNYTSPKQVAAGVVSAAAGSNHILFLRRGPPVAPTITSQPQSLSIATGNSATFAVTTTGLPSPNYQWRKDGAPIGGANSNTYTIPAGSTADAGDYDVVVSSALASVISNPAALAVAVPIPPSIATQPASETWQVIGASVTLAVSAAGTGPLTFQWYKDESPVIGQTSANLQLNNLQSTDDGTYSVTVTSDFGSVSSNPAVLHLAALPQVTSASDQLQVPALGAALNLTVTASSEYAPLTYQWTKDNRVIAGATNANYTLPDVTDGDAGAYTLAITDAHGFVTRHTTFVLPRHPQTQVIAWGNSQTPTPQSSVDLPDVLAIDSTPTQAYLLQADGSVLARNAATGGVASVSGMSNIVAVAGGYSSDLFLRADGTVAQLGTPASSADTVPSNLEGVIAIAKGFNHGLALKSDGTVVAWGSDAAGQIDVPAGLNNVVAIAAGDSHSLALRADGSVVAWGANNNGQATVPALLQNVVRIVAQGNISVAILADGTVAAWGYTFGGVVAAAPALTAVRDFSLIGDFGYAVHLDGTLETVPANPVDNIAPIPGNVAPVIAICARYLPVVALRDSSGDAPPVIATPPMAGTHYVGESQTFSVTAAGVGPFYYQWRKDGVDLPIGLDATLTLPSLSVADAGSYDVVISSHAGTVTSAAVPLTVIPLPVIAGLSPARQVLEPGQALDLGVNATGTRALTFQWYRNGRAVTGATASAYHVDHVSQFDTGHYWVVVTDSNGRTQGPTYFVRCAPSFTQVRGWGINTSNQISIPSGLHDAVALAAGYDVSIALHPDGTVTTWGYYGSTQPTGWTDIVDVAAGSEYYLGLRADGTVVESGDNHSYPLPDGLTNVVELYKASSTECAALKADGTVIIWGGYTDGQLNFPAAVSHVVEIATDGSTLLALRNDGTVVAWGPNVSGGMIVLAGLDQIVQVVPGYALNQDGTVVAIDVGAGTLTPLAGVTDAVALSTSAGHLLILHGNGVVTAMGTDSHGESDVPPDLGPAVGVAAGALYSLALVDATSATAPQIVDQPGALAVLETQGAQFKVVASGGTPLSYQWLKDGTPIPGATSPTLTIPETAVSDGGSYDVVVSNYLGTTTSNAVMLTIVPLPVVILVSDPRQVVAPGQALQLSATATGTGTLSYQWYHNGQPVTGATSLDYSVASAAGTDSGYYFIDVTDANGTRRGKPTFVVVMPAAIDLIGWGLDSYGQASGAPVNDRGFISVSCSRNYTLGLHRDGTVVLWGNGGTGLTPPADLVDIVAISTAEHSCLALKSDGTVVAWGDDTHGGLDVPAGLHDVVAVSAYDGKNLALKSDGSMVNWGTNSGDYGGLPAGLPAAVAINAGHYEFAVLADGRVAAWSVDFTYSGYPFPSALTNVKSIFGSGTTSLSLRNDGSLASWGSNDLWGQPLAPANLGPIAAIALGYFHTLALLQDGTVQAWGETAYGATAVPSGLNHVVAIAAGGYTSFALRDATGPTLPCLSLSPASSTVTVGQQLTLSVRAVGTPDPNYQWLFNGTIIPGANAATYSIASVTAGQAGDYSVVVTNSAGSVTSSQATITVNQASQSIYFPPPGDRSFTTTPITLYATASSGLPVAYTVVSGAATVVGNQLTLTGTGVVTVAASQPGNDTYAGATSLQISFNVTPNLASWQLTHFTTDELANTAISGPTAVYGQDGLSNLVKYTLGLDPKQNATTGLPTVTTDGTNWIYTFTKPTAVTDVQFTVEVSTDLVTWSSSGVTLTLVSSANGTDTWQATYPVGSTTSVFFHLRVSQ